MGLGSSDDDGPRRRHLWQVGLPRIPTSRRGCHRRQRRHRRRCDRDPSFRLQPHRDAVSWTPSSSSFEGFIPLPARSSHHAASEAFAARRHPARSGGLSAPRAGFSSQARALLARRASAATAAAASEGAAYAAATTVKIRHEPDSGFSDDDEYEAE